MVCAGITLAGSRITIQYNASDGTRGASFSNPYRMVDVVDTIGAGCTQSAYLFYIPYSIWVSGAATYFKTINEVIYINTTTNSDAFYINVGANYIASAYYSAGSAWQQGGGTTIVFMYRCDVMLRGTVDRIKLVNCGYILLESGTYTNFWAEHFITLIFANSTVNYMYLTNYGENTHMTFHGSGNSLSNIWVNNIRFNAYVYSTTLQNMIFNNPTYDVYINPYYGHTPTIAIRNCRIDYTKYTINTAGTGTNTIYYQNTFKINIVDGDGGTATLYDSSLNVVATQVLSGEWERITNYVKHVVQTAGALLLDEQTVYQPFTLKVSKDGYQELEISGITVTGEFPTQIRGDMVLEEPFKTHITNSILYNSNIY